MPREQSKPSDHETILADIVEQPCYEATRAALRPTLAGVQVGAVPVLVVSEQHCSGG